MIDDIKRASGKAKRYTIIGCAVAIMFLPSFFMDFALAAVIIVMALLNRGE